MDNWVKVVGCVKVWLMGDVFGARLLIGALSVWVLVSVLLGCVMIAVL